MTQRENSTVFLNGRFVPRDQAVLDIEDRGVLFAQGVYEVTRFYAGRPLAIDAHVARLRDSLAAVGIPEPSELGRFTAYSEELLDRNGLRDAAVYWQVSAGVAPRADRLATGMTPTVVMIAYPADPLPAADAVDQTPAPRTAILTPDERWGRCDIKSLMLLPNLMAQRRGAEADADTAIFHRDKTVTEATNANVFIVREGELFTHPADHRILNGISRQILIEEARGALIACHERAFNVDELLAADEVLICGTTVHVASVVRVGDRSIGDGTPGAVARLLHGLFIDHVRRVCRR